jgi:hypothetical protein
LSKVVRAHLGSIRPDDNLAPLMDRVLMRGELSSLTAEGERARSEARREDAEEQAAPAPEAQAGERPEPAGGRTHATVKLGPGFVPKSPALPAAQAAAVDAVAEPVDEGSRKTLELGSGFVPKSPASPAAQAAAAVVPARTTVVPVRTTAVPRAQVPREYAPFPLAKPRWERRRSTRRLAYGLVAVLSVAAVVLTVHASGMRVTFGGAHAVMPAPSVAAAAPSVVVLVPEPVAPAVPVPDPEPPPVGSAAAPAAASAEAPPAATATATAPPAPSAAPPKARNVKKVRVEIIE